MISSIYTSPGEKEHHDGDPEVGGGGVDPHLDGQGLEEGEWVGRRRELLLVEDADTWRLCDR